MYCTPVCLTVLVLLNQFFFVTFPNVPFFFFFSPGGAFAHSYWQPEEIGSSAVLWPWQYTSQQRSKQRLWDWRHQPARWARTRLSFVCEYGSLMYWSSSKWRTLGHILEVMRPLSIPLDIELIRFYDKLMQKSIFQMIPILSLSAVAAQVLVSYSD